MVGVEKVKNVGVQNFCYPVESCDGEVGYSPFDIGVGPGAQLELAGHVLLAQLAADAQNTDPISQSFFHGMKLPIY